MVYIEIEMVVEVVAVVVEFVIEGFLLVEKEYLIFDCHFDLVEILALYCH